MSDDLTTLSGVGPATEEKLLDAGYETYQSIASADSGKLSEKADIGDSTSTDVIQAARDEADIGGFETATEVNSQRKKIDKISTLVPEVDELLGGGVETQSITEVYGGFGSGKSQLTHQLCVNVQLPPEHGGANGRALFIDTEDSFRPERITEMVRGLPEDALQAVIDREDGLDMTPEAVKESDLTGELGDRTQGTPAHELTERFTDRIHVSGAFTSDHQLLLAEEALDMANKYAGSEFPMKLLCVDSVMAHLRAEYVGRGELAPRQQKLNRHLHDLQKFANLHNAASVIANQVQSNPDSYFGDPTKPIGGNILGHTSTFRLYIRNSKDDKRLLKLVDAPNLPDGESVLRITMDGVKPE
jgi:DNA repair protein RadA